MVKHRELVNYFLKHNPRKLGKIDQLIKYYGGNPNYLDYRLKLKYGESLYEFFRGWWRR